MPKFFGVNDEERVKKYTKIWVNYLNKYQEKGESKKPFKRLKKDQLESLSKILGKFELDPKEKKLIVKGLLKLIKQNLLTEKQISELSELTLPQLLQLSSTIIKGKSLKPFEQLEKNQLESLSEILAEFRLKPKENALIVNGLLKLANQNLLKNKQINELSELTLPQLLQLSAIINKLDNAFKSIYVANRANKNPFIPIIDKYKHIAQINKKLGTNDQSKIIKAFEITKVTKNTLKEYIIKVANEIKRFFMLKNIKDKQNLKKLRKPPKGQKRKIKSINEELQGFFKTTDITTGKKQSVRSSVPSKKTNLNI